MTVSSISGDFGIVSQMTCILYEGTITIGSGEDFMGSGTGTIGYGAKLVQGEWVALSTDTGNTYDATSGLPVVTKVANNVDLVFGQIIDTPRWVKIPATTQATWATMLSSGYYRVATVQFAPLLVTKATLITANAVAVTPGGTGLLDVDVSETTGANRITVNDIAGAAGSANMFSFHYQAQASATTVSILLGIKGLMTAAT